jgi:hypothetical protein
MLQVARSRTSGNNIGNCQAARDGIATPSFDFKNLLKAATALSGSDNWLLVHLSFQLRLS